MVAGGFGLQRSRGRCGTTMKTLAYFVVAVVDAYILTSIVSTQLVLADIQSFGLAVSFGDRVQATLHDLLGLALPLLVLIGLSFLVAFAVARYAFRTIGGNKMMWFMVAGFTSVPAGIVLIKYFMGGTLLASARTSLGMLLVALCGMAGGWVFAYLTSRFGRVSADA
jgi:hypothetical protein